MPLTDLVRALPGVSDQALAACACLKFRNTIVVYLRVDSQDLFPDQWIYVHAPDLAVGRIANFRNWIPDLYGDNPETILSLEFWCDPDDTLWNQPDALHIEQATRDLRETGLIGNAPISAGYVVRIPFCYPVYRLGYRDHLKRIQDYLKTIRGLEVIGRSGSFKYNNQDHSLLMGILAAEKLALSRNHDLWEVNTDDAYHEKSMIDETGLVPRCHSPL
jgi:protoporphyrinogen oxidase